MLQSTSFNKTVIFWLPYNRIFVNKMSTSQNQCGNKQVVRELEKTVNRVLRLRNSQVSKSNVRAHETETFSETFGKKFMQKINGLLHNFVKIIFGALGSIRSSTLSLQRNQNSQDEAPTDKNFDEYLTVQSNSECRWMKADNSCVSTSERVRLQWLQQGLYNIQLRGPVTLPFFVI